MSFIFFIAIIVLFFLCLSTRSKIEKNENEIAILKKKLYDVTAKHNELCEQLKENNVVADAPKVEQPIVHPYYNQYPYVPQPGYYYPPAGIPNAPFVYGQPPAMPQQTPVQQPPAAQAAAPAETIASEPTAAVSTEKAQAPTIVEAASVFKAAPEQETAPAASEEPVQREEPIHRVYKEQKKVHIEEWLGTRLFNIAASVLIFIGLILFCTLDKEIVGNGVKTAAMFAVSAGFIAVGTFLSHKDKSIFPRGLLGCGFGMFFISILLSHVYFEIIEYIPAFSMILVWSAFALYMSKKLDSVMLSVTAHIGTAVSICFAFSYSYTSDKAAILSVYQIVSLAVIILGNIFCCRRTYRFGLLMSEFLLLYTSVAMSSVFRSSAIMPDDIPVYFAVILYSLQFISLSFVSYLISTSASALERTKLIFSRAPVIIQIVNKFLWIMGTIASAGCITGFICENVLNVSSKAPIVTVFCAASLLHLAVTVLIMEKLDFSKILSGISIIAVSLMLTLSLLTDPTETGFPFVFVYVLILAAIFKKTRNAFISPTAVTALLLEAIYVTLYGFNTAENSVLSALYMACVGLAALVLWFVQSGADKQLYFQSLKIVEYLWVFVSIISINLTSNCGYSFSLAMCEFALLHIICSAVGYAGKKEKHLGTICTCGHILTCGMGILAIMIRPISIFGNNTTAEIFALIMIAVSTVVLIRNFVVSDNTSKHIGAAVFSSALIMSFFISFSKDVKAFYIITNVLDLSPSLFLFTVALVLIYRYKKKASLYNLIIFPLLLDMLLTGLFGYIRLSDYYGSCCISSGSNAALHAVLCLSCLLHSAADTYIIRLMYKTAKKFGHPTLGDTSEKMISYFWVTGSLSLITYTAFSHTIADDCNFTAAFIVLTTLNAIILGFELTGEYKGFFTLAVRICSALIFFVSMLVFSHNDGSTLKYALSIVLMLTSLALFFAKARLLIKYEHEFIFHVYIGLNATIFANFLCSSLYDGFDMAFTFSIVSMATALLCIISGFILKLKGLRIYGLVVTIICIIKLVTLDISEAESLERVVAFVTGGIICFIISGIYNKVEKKISANEN